MALNSTTREPLSARQAEIAALIARGKNTREIAATLFLSPRTVDNHIAAIFNKVGVSSRAELVSTLWRTEIARSGEPSAAVGGARTNLPTSRTTLLARESEITDIARSLGESCLATIVGAGGIGKTRTAIAVGSLLLDDFPAGVWFVQLAPLTQGSFVAAAVAQALNVRESPARPLLDAVVAAVKAKSLLLILDNCEHVIAQAATLADFLLRECPSMRILATSREPLRIAGEQIYRLPALSVPGPHDVRTLGAVEAERFPAVMLFVQRARDADRRFALTDENAPVVADICRRLDGLPLAIELAAAQTRTLAVKTLSDKLDSRFRLLTGGERTAPPRQQTLQAVLDWSYELLAPDEAQLFELLSIFVGGSTLESAAAAFADDSGGEFELLDRLSSLVDKSLVATSVEGGALRYSMLESTREYAREKLVARGAFDRAAQRHAVALLTLAAQLSDQWDTLSEREWNARAEPEAADWRAALSWALDARKDIVLGQRLAGALVHFFTNCGPAEGLRWIRTALTEVGAETDPAIVAKLELNEALFSNAIQQPKAALMPAERALQQYRNRGDPAGVAYALTALGWALISLNDAQRAEVMLREALAVARKLGNRRLLCLILGCLGYSGLMQGDDDFARACYLEELELCNATGAETDAVYVASNLAELEMMRGDASAALRYASVALARARELNDRALLTALLEDTSMYLLASGAYAQALELAREGFEPARQANLEVHLLFMVQHVAAATALQTSVNAAGFAERGACRLGATLLGYVDARLALLDAGRGPIEERERGELRAVLHSVLGGEELERLCAAGALLSEDEAIDIARSI